MPSLGWFAVTACLLAGQALAAQSPGASRPGRFALGVSIGTSAFSGGARGHGEDGEPISFYPYRPTMLGLAMSWGREQLRLEAAARYGEPGLALRGAPIAEAGTIPGSVVLVAENAFRVSSFMAGASAPLIRLREGPTLRMSAALVMERWTTPDAPARTIGGGQAGLQLELALTGSLAARLGGELGVTPRSPFRTDDLPAGFTRSTTWRRSLGVSLAWRP
jgi:hypothetical protein